MLAPVRINNNDLDLRFDWALNSLEEVKDSSSKNVYDIGSGKELLKNKIVSSGLTYTAFDIYPINETVKKWLEGKAPKKIIYVRNKMVNVVV